jgi:hypothetical protein
VAQPIRHRWNIDTALDGRCCENIAHIVMGHIRDPDGFGRCGQ